MDSAPWNPAQYLKYGDARLRPGYDLLARVGAIPPGPIYELGCGTGEHARAIAARWPSHAVTAVDHSPEMLEKARSAPAPANLGWHEADIDGWSAPEPAALIFSNATLHWLPYHRRLFAHLTRQLAPEGVLAVQMPDNFRAPSHALIRELALEPPYAARLAPLTQPGGSLRDDLVEAPAFYYEILAQFSSYIDIWHTEYFTLLHGERPVLEWIKGSILRPALDRLDELERRRFEDALAARLATAYPRRADDVTLLPFRRIFMVARRLGGIAPALRHA
jgi:trans-aconitate 2-methyltransferase